MPKNKGRNAFFFFMIDWKSRMEAQGRNFPNGLEDVQRDPDCSEKWQSLTKQQKGIYEAKAKKDKITSQIANKDKKTSFGESVRMLERKEREKQMFRINMNENIKVIIDSAVNLNFLRQLKFCFVHTNWFFVKIVNNKQEYFPAEYAFGVFSFENGIEEIYHEIVSSKIPLGYRREALEWSNNTHNILIENSQGEDDFVVMYAKLINFLESRKVVDKYPYLYTRKTFVKPVQSLIEQLCDAVEQDKEPKFKVYELEALFIHLANKVYKKRTDRDTKFVPVFADNVFTHYTYTFKKGFECYVHKYVDNGTEHCSKSILYQWAWTLCDEFCEPLGIEVKPGIHNPKKSQNASVSTVMDLINNLQIKEISSGSESKPVLSMTGVSEQHRLKVSSRTYEEEMHRRNESKPVKVIDCSKLQESVNKPNESVQSTSRSDKSTEEKKYMPRYLNGKPLRSPINVSYYMTSEDTLSKDDASSSFIGGRGVSIRSRIQNIKKAPLGKGQEHT